MDERCDYLRGCPICRPELSLEGRDDRCWADNEEVEHALKSVPVVVMAFTECAKLGTGRLGLCEHHEGLILEGSQG